MKKHLSIVFLLLMACNNSFQDEPSMELALEAAKDREYDVSTEEFIDIVDFTKVDGIKRNVFGQSLYQFDYKLTVVVKRDCFSPKPMFSSRYILNFMDEEDLSEFLRKSAHPKYFTHKKGDTLSVEDDVNFEKTENGWKNQVK